MDEIKAQLKSKYFTLNSLLASNPNFIRKNIKEAAAPTKQSILSGKPATNFDQILLFVDQLKEKVNKKEESVPSSVSDFFNKTE